MKLKKQWNRAAARPESFSRSGIGQSLGRTAAAKGPQSDGAVGMRAIPALNPKSESSATRIVRRLSKQSALPVNAKATERRTKQKQDAGKQPVPIL